jgi:hypothetical protein
MKIEGKIEGAPASLFRHPAWLAWKEKQGWRRMDTGLGFSLLIRSIGTKGSMAYVTDPGSIPGVRLRPRDERGAILEVLSLSLLPFLPPDCVFIRWDLMTRAWTGSDGQPLERHLLELRMNASTIRRRLRKAPLENTCPDTMIVDLEGGEEAIRSRMDGRTRYSVRLAGRRGTMVERAGEAGLPAFYALYRETAARQEIVLPPEPLFRDLFRSARDYGLDLDLYLARSQEKPCAAAIVARHKDEAWYLFAASSAEHRAAAGPSAILYRAMIDCARAGARRMDLLGVGPPGTEDHPLSGLTLFKKGFGGERLTRAGTWDYVLDPGEYIPYVRMESIA